MDQSKALTKLQTARESGYLVYARDEELELMHQQYETLITTVSFGKDDFVHVGGGKYYPLKHAQNKIAEACGVSYTDNCGTKERGKFSELQVVQEGDLFIVKGDYSIIGWAQGTRVKPDGQLRTSSVCEYEFSVSDRCNLDFISSKYPPKTIQDARRKLLDTKKFATRRADTGSKLSVVRELSWLPTGFDQADIIKPMVFTQVVESNDYKHKILGSLMSTPDGREHVANAMLGTKTKLFGPGEAKVEPSKEAPKLDDHKPKSNDSIPFTENKTEDVTESPEVIELKDALLDWMGIGEFDSSKEDKANVNRLISDPDVSIDELKRVVTFVKQRRASRQHQA